MTYVQAPAHRLPVEGESLFRSSRPDYRVDENGCWVWIKSLSPQGYASDYGHRKYYERANGPIPDGYHVHHRCENRACINPEHLEAIDPTDHFMHHKLLAKGLTLDDIRDIRRLGRDASIRTRDIARGYGVAWSLIIAYLNGDYYADRLGATGGKVLADKRAICAAPDCAEQIAPTKKRHAKFCSPDCRSRTNGNTPEQKAKKAERQRRRRARLAAAFDERGESR